MTTQASAGGISDLQFSNLGQIMHSAPVEIAECFGIVIELLLIEKGSRLKHCGSIECRRSLRIEIGEALAERQSAGQLDKANQVPALAAAVAIEDIFASVHIERRPGLLVQRTESDKLRAAHRPGSPVMLSQIVQQRHPPLECFDVLAHNAFSPPEPSVGERRRQSQARMVGERVFSKKQGPEVLQNRSYPGQWPRFINSLMRAIQPMSHTGNSLTEKGRCRLRTVKAPRPAAGCGRIGQTVGILEFRHRLLP